MPKTCSEILFEKWLTSNGLSFRQVPTGRSASPDYGVIIDGVEIIFEVKQIETNNNWKDHVVHGGEVGQFIRERINGSKKQIQAASRQRSPTVLVIYNDYDPLQLSGTEDHDFEQAMYGAYTVRIDTDSRRIVDRFHGNGKSFQTRKNTSFSSLARLRRFGREARLDMTIFENVHAAVPINYDTLPSCFGVVRFEPPSTGLLEQETRTE